MPMQKSALIIISSCIVVLNLADILIHVLTGQPELLRITGNIVLIIVAIGSYWSVPTKTLALLFLSAGSINLILNLVFINQNTIGGLGIVLITISTILSLMGYGTSRASAM